MRAGKRLHAFLMNDIIAAVFDDESAATHAIDALEGAGFERDDVDHFKLNAPGQHHKLPLGGDKQADAGAHGAESGALRGAAVGAVVGLAAGAAAAPVVGPAAILGGLAGGTYAGSLAGAMKTMGSEEQPHPIERPAGVMVAVHATAQDDSAVAVDLLRESGARMIERAEGVWKNGKWSDFDPTEPPQRLLVEP